MVVGSPPSMRWTSTGQPSIRTRKTSASRKKRKRRTRRKRRSGVRTRPLMTLASGCIRWSSRAAKVSHSTGASVTSLGCLRMATLLSRRAANAARSRVILSSCGSTSKRSQASSSTKRKRPRTVKTVKARMTGSVAKPARPEFVTVERGAGVAFDISRDVQKDDVSALRDAVAGIVQARHHSFQQMAGRELRRLPPPYGLAID
mmetsp:Transcript_45760/g.116255  ORF Transcript_45760/g.116255 Transcript_45760/m.116255 type:complete len:203 (-) Transcript_45760:10-618(-)